MCSLPRIQLIRLRLIKEAFKDPDYIFELKHDGFRAIVYIEDEECRLVSKEVLSKLNVKNAIFDGEIVCIGSRAVGR